MVGLTLWDRNFRLTLSGGADIGFSLPKIEKEKAERAGQACNFNIIYFQYESLLQRGEDF